MVIVVEKTPEVGTNVSCLVDGSSSSCSGMVLDVPVTGA